MPSDSRPTAYGPSLAERLPAFLFPRLSGLHLIALFIALFLFGFLIFPVLQVVYVAFLDPNSGGLTLQNFGDFLRSSLFRESFYNSFYVSAMSVEIGRAHV